MRRAFTMSSISAFALALAARGGSVRLRFRHGQMPTGGAGSGGGGGSGTGGSMTINCGDINQAIDPTAVIDDMETPDYMTVRAGGRSGAWWAGGDPDSPDAIITPNGDARRRADPGRPLRQQVRDARHRAGLSPMWAVLSVSMGWGSVDGGAAGLLPNDNDFRTGVTFWARIGDTSSNKVRLADQRQVLAPRGRHLRRTATDRASPATTRTAST